MPFLRPQPGLVLIALMTVLTACHSDRSLQVVAQLERAPGNITVTPDRRIVVSLHQFFEPQWRVAEWTGGGLKPFPDTRIAEGRHPDVKLHSVLGIQSDSRGVVWMLDNGMRGDATPKLVAWDTRKERLHKIIHLPAPATPGNAFVNDLAIDEHHNKIYITDPAGGANAALVVDIESGVARRVLEGHVSVVSQPIDLTVEGTPLQINQADGTLVSPHVGANPIALDSANGWLYYGPMHGTRLYRLTTADLINDGLAPAELAGRVEEYATKPICDGISMDNRGNIYVTDVANQAIGVIDPQRRYRVLVQDERLPWPDALSFGPEQRLYTVSNQLHRSAVLNAGKETAQAPFYIFSLKPLAEGVPGR